MMEMLSGKIEGMEKYEILKKAERGLVDVDDISDFNMYCLAKRYLRAKRIQREIGELEEKSRKRREEKAKKILGP